MSLILSFLQRMLIPALLGLVAFFAVRPLRLRCLRRLGRRSPPAREAGLLVFVMFLAGLANLTIAPWSGQGASTVNLIPFTVIADTAAAWAAGNKAPLLINFLGNIVMFLPLGFFPALLWDRPTWRRSAAVGLGTSLLIEVCQLPLMRGSDVDDLWLNTLGALLGYGLYAVIRTAWPGLCERFRWKEI